MIHRKFNHSPVNHIKIPAQNMRNTLLVSLLTLMTIITCNSFGQTTSYLADVEQWHTSRIDALKMPNGWLNLEGLYWLKEGVNQFGADSKNDLVYSNPAFPKHLGDFILNGGKVFWKNAAGQSITVKTATDAVVQDISNVNLLSKTDGEFTSHWKNFTWIVIQREDKIGIRFRNLKAKTLLEFKGIERFPVEAKWHIKAKVIPQDQNPLMIMNVLGQNTAQKHGGKLVFEIEGKTYQLDAIDEGGTRLFVAFSDATSGNTTYGSGRFIELERPDATGYTYIDFNKAYNPPCAFTEFATCPLPPPQNRMSIAIPAGEKKYGHH
jgi:uncharacterized protein (DUF1684 family)